MDAMSYSDDYVTPHREIGGREEYQVGNDGKATLIRTADGKTKAAPPPTSGKSHVTLQIGLTAAMVGLFGFMGKKFMTKLQDSQAEKEKDAKIKQTLEDIKKRKTQAEVEATKMRASKRSNAMQPVEADDGSPSETSEVMSALEPTEDHTQLLMEVRLRPCGGGLRSKGVARVWRCKYRDFLNHTVAGSPFE